MNPVYGTARGQKGYGALGGNSETLLYDHSPNINSNLR